MSNGWPDRMLTAIHESGHCVAARAFGLRGGGARIYNTPSGVSGFFESEYVEVMGRIWDKPRKPVAAIHCKIIIGAAGSAAEEEICGGSRDAIGDDEQIAFLLALLPEGSRREDRFCRFARRLVKRHREAIINVAADLALASELHGCQIDALVREART
jgi:hypothetical protein